MVRETNINKGKTARKEGEQSLGEGIFDLKSYIRDKSNGGERKQLFFEWLSINQQKEYSFPLLPSRNRETSNKVKREQQREWESFQKTKVEKVTSLRRMDTNWRR